MRTPLHLASAAVQLNAVEYLLNEGGVQVNPKDRWGSTPLDYAEKSPLIADLIKKHGGVNQVPVTSFALKHD